MIHLIRHAQASFGAADYDKLSDLGHRQSALLGAALARQGVVPDQLFIGAQKRHRETLESMGLDAARATVLPGLNEFDFKGLLDARFRDGGAPDGLHDDRRQHFRSLRDTVLMWQRNQIPDPPESWDAFSERVVGALDAMSGAGTVVAVSSGGAIGLSVALALGAPADAMIRLQLQIKNCAVTRFVVGRNARHLHGFNETPHIDATNEADMLTYS